MRKIILNFTTIAIIVLLGACGQDEVFEVNHNDPIIETGRILSLTASMPSEDPATRVGLEQLEDKTIALTWEAKDEIELAFVQGENKIKGNAKIASISEDGKKAQFDIIIPDGIIDGDFDLYGVYGGGGLDDIDPTHVILPINADNAGSLASVQEKAHVMLYFESKGMNESKSNTSVIFNHLGSLFSITVKNTYSTSLDNLSEARLVGPEGGKWAFNSGDGGASYDVVNGQFLNIENAGNYISFNAITNTLKSSESITFWGWYPPMPDINWPDLKLELRDLNDVVISTSVNPKPTRSTATATGKSFYFYAEWNGTHLGFTLPNNYFTDSRDGNTYETVTIGNQVWMAENLKYLPSVVGPTTGSKTSPYYYVYGYDGTDVNEAKATANYSTYGVLYNESAVMAESVYDNNNPDGFQGVCPKGWHLPNDAMWQQLIQLSGYDHIGRNLGGVKLKEAGSTHWKFYSYATRATNEFSFTALPGGLRTENGSFSSIGLGGYWWSVAEISGHWRMWYDSDDIIREYDNKDLGNSVRCVRGFEPSYTQTITTTNVAAINPTSAVSGGYITDDGSIVIARGVCWSTNNTPSINNNKTSDGAGAGSFSSNISGLQSNTTYHVRAYATNNNGTNYGNTYSFTTHPIGSAGSITDSRDGNVYKTVTIGNQVWMAENLKYLPEVWPGIASSRFNPYYYVYDYHGRDVSAAKATPNYNIYGVLYNWPAAMAEQKSSNSNPSGVQGICPTGWHIPSDAEWKQLIDYLGGDVIAVNKLKVAGTAHWQSPNPNNVATNESGFTALPGAHRITDVAAYFYHIGRSGNWWSTRANDTYPYDHAYYMTINNDYNSNVRRGAYEMAYGHSVRCVKTLEPPSTPKITTIEITEFTQTTVKLGGNISDEGGASVTARGVCWGTNELPTIGDSKTEDGTGKGSFTSNITDLTPGTTYYMRAYATNSVGTAYGSVVSFMRYNDGIAGSFTDSRDGNVYQTITIGNQDWMAENLKYLPKVVGPATGSNTSPYYYVYDYDGTYVYAAKATNNYKTYGVLYNWPAAMAGSTSSNANPSGVQGVCPTGWHLPSDAEFTQLTDYLGGLAIAGGKLKEAGTAHWESTWGTTNETGFTALPGGCRYYNGTFESIGKSCYLRSTYENSDTQALAWFMGTGSSINKRDYFRKEDGYSVRCVRD